MSGVVYFARAAKGIKIGYSEHIEQRMKTLKREQGAIEVLGVVYGSLDVEYDLQMRFDAHRIPTKDGYQFGEWFTPHADILAFIACYTVPGIEFLPDYHSPTTLYPIDVDDDDYEILQFIAFATGAVIAIQIRWALSDYLLNHADISVSGVLPRKPTKKRKVAS